MGFSICLVTAPGLEEARELARRALEARLCACVNLVPSIESHYWWEGQIETSQEVLLIFKTRSEGVAAMVEAIRGWHSYAVPEVISLSVEGGNPDYLGWLAAEVR